ncbi:hypothetical protein PG984_008252 [Apiospora sp. TS-2023a]
MPITELHRIVKPAARLQQARPETQTECSPDICTSPNLAYKRRCRQAAGAIRTTCRPVTYLIRPVCRGRRDSQGGQKLKLSSNPGFAFSHDIAAVMLLRGAEGLSFNNPNPRQLAGPRFLHELIPHQGNSDGTPALDYSDRDGRQSTLSYTDLHRLSDGLAARIVHELQLQLQHGSEPNNRSRCPLVVPLMIPQSPELYLAILAILKCGGAFCPLNLDAPSERVGFILGDVKASIVLTTRALAPSILPRDGVVACTVLCVDELLDLDAPSLEIQNGAAAFTTQRPPPDERDLAYVMYTSGSTGTPKGVGVCHLAATQSLLAHDRHIPPFSRFLQFAAPTFDVSVFEIFFPLFRGATLVSCDRARLLTDLPGVIRELDVDACELTPSVAGSLLKTRRNAPNLRLLLTIGEMLTQPVIDEFGGGGDDEETGPGILWGMYGPTEAAIHCTLQPAFRKEYSTRCIGFPLDTVSSFVIRITDETTTDSSQELFDLLPLGEVGELAVGGHQLASGYINRPEQTTQAFLETKQYGRVYKTGDKALMRPDGSIECLGRVSEGQVKLNGQRMELGEIEHAILRTRGCHSSYVCVLHNLLVAFVAAETEDRDSSSNVEERIRATCKDWLPAFMVPAEIVTMDSFPQLPSGKIDRRRLRDDYGQGKYTTTTDNTSVSQPDKHLNDVQWRLCETVSQVLQAPVSLSTNLMAAGLDSLVSIALAARLRDNGHAVNTLDVIKARTALDLYNLVSSAGVPNNNTPEHDGNNHPKDTNKVSLHHQSDADLSVLVNGNLKDVEGHFRCTELQKSMVAETLRDPRLYINTMDITFPPGHSPDTVKSWVLQVSACNDILRTGFMHSGDELIQIVWNSLKEDQVQVVEDFTSLPLLQDTEKFLERPLRVEIITATSDGSSSHQEATKARLFVHHALYDGWSFDLLLDDLTSLAQGKPPAKRPQFHDIAQQLASLSNGDQNNNLITVHEFWAEHLRGAANNSLPNFRTTAFDKPEISSVCGEITTVTPADVRQVCLETASSSQAIFQACLVWFWSALTGSDDVTIGSVFSGRTLHVPGIEKAMGPCIQTLPVRTRLGQCRTVRDLVRSLHSTNRQILQLAAPISLASIRKTAGLPPGCRLFDVLFVYQDTLSNRARESDKDSVVREVGHQDYSEVKLLVEIEPRKDRFAYRSTWHTDCFSSSQIESFAQSLGHLVDYVVGHIDEPISSILPSFPREMLSTYTPTPSTKIPPGTTSPNVVAMVEHTAAANKGHDALCFADAISVSDIATSLMTYKELNETANQVARHLRAQKVEPGGIVAIVMEKSPWLYCGILGILKAGCAYLPILPSTPIRRIQLIFEQAQPQLCLLDKDLSSFLGKDDNLGESCPLVAFDADILKQYSPSNLDLTIPPSQLAYVIYTSGTTGVPKGVAVTHGNLHSNIETLSHIYPLHDPPTSSRMLQICSQAFDVSVFEIFFAWANGLCLCAGTNDTLFEDLELSIRQLEVTHLSMTVTVASLVDPENVPLVDFLVTSGEPMTDEVAAKWAPKLYQGYGPSETTNICTVRKMAVGDSSQYLGWSFDNTSSFVMSLDDSNPNSVTPVPIGCVGEFCFGGDQVAAGYLNMPELTVSKFVDHPEYGRIYRSGDLGRMLSDGSLIILGRIDTQIKLRGQRIELQDVHAPILGSGLARACASVVWQRENDKSQNLTSFYVPLHQEEDQHFSVLDLDEDEALRTANLSISQALQASLPSYMLPTFLVPISRTPLTSSGKINTGALRDSIQSLRDDVLQKYVFHGGDGSGQDQEENTTVAEWTETERAIAAALAGTLGIGLGQTQPGAPARVKGHYIRGAQTHERGAAVQLLISKERKSPVATPDTKKDAEAPSSLLPDDLCADIETRFRALVEDDEKLAIESILPCTPLQEAMLASSASSSDGTAYRNQMLFRLQRAPDEIRSYWDEMCARHGILRTCFLTTDNTDFPFLQVVLGPTTGSALPWSHLDSADVAQSAREHMHAAFGHPVNSLKPPLGLAFIHDSSSSEADGDGETYYLSFVCHHALYDGMAMEQLLFEIETLAHGQALPEPPIPFRDFLQEALSLPPGADDFWKSQFTAFMPQKLPSRLALATDVDLPETAMSSIKNSTTVPLKALETRAHESYGATLSSLCQAAWAATLATVLGGGGSSDICFGNVVSGRSIPLEGVDRLVAPCFNTVPLRIDMSKDLSGSKIDLVKRCRDANVGIMPFQFTPLRRIQAALVKNEKNKRGEDCSGQQLFDTMVLLQPPSRVLDGTVWALEEERGDMDVPLICEFVTATDNDTLRVVIHHQETYVSYSMASLLREIVLQALRSFVESPSSGLDLLANMSPPLRSAVEDIRAGAQSEKQVCDDAVATDMASSDSFDQEEGLPTDIESTVQNVVTKLAKIDGVVVTTKTSLHRLGIDSIGMVQLVYLLRQEGLEISPVDVFENPTCAGIAQRCTKLETKADNKNQQSSSSSTAYDLTGFQQRVRDQVSASTSKGGDDQAHMLLPCTPVQQGMISQSIHSHGNTYINSVSWDLDSSVDMETLECAWRAIVQRHDILRTGFLPISDPDASFAMVIHPAEGNVPPIEVFGSCETAVTEFDITSWRARCRDGMMRDLLVPPWRVALIDKEDKEVKQEGEGGISKQMHLAMHHALYDAFSLRSLLRELTDIMLPASHDQQPTCIKPPSLESAVKAVFTDMAHEKPEAEQFWRSQAAEAVVNPFPTMTPLRVEDGTTARSTRLSTIPLPALKQQAAKAEVTFQAALQAAWARTLSAYLGESSVTFGVVLDSRSAASTDNGEEALLPRITTLPVIANAAADSNRDMLGSMMAFNANLRRCLNVPLPQVQKWLGHSTGSPLFDTILVYQAKDQGMRDNSGPWRVRDETAAVDYPISLEIEEEEEDTDASTGPSSSSSSSSSLSFNLVYRTDILPPPQAKLLLDQFDAILSHLLEHPEGSADELASIKPDVFSILPPEYPELPSGGVHLLHEFVAKSAESLPLEKTALEYVEELGNDDEGRGPKQTWTYRELDAAGNQVAHMLVQRGSVRPGDIVAVCFDKCPEAYLAILGILKAGAAFVALDASAPASRLGFILSDSGAVALLHRGGGPENADDGLAAELSASSTVPSIAISLDELSEYPSSPPELARPITPEDTCYCLYTSGTTGTPKGCLISHESTVQAMLAFQALFSGHWDIDSRWLQFASLHFDVSILEQYWSWSVGITMVAAPRDVVLSDLTRTISELGITHIDLTPSLARLVHPDEVPSLCRGVFITGGEQLRQDILDVWGSKGVIYNAYGPTEATIGVTMYPRVPQNGRSSNIGKQFLNVGSFVFRPGTEIPVLKGAVGELCVSGKLVGKGYLNRPELTVERFPVLSSRFEGQRVYRTGDLVRVLHDGCFDFLGRADDQVKLRGQRLEIGEINHTVRAGVSGVSDVATLVARHGQQDRDVLVSFIVNNDNTPNQNNHEASSGKLTVMTDSQSAKVCAEARDACRAKLPGYMVPTYFLCVPTIPLSANNKAQIGVLKQLFNEISLDQLRQLSSSSAAAGGEDGAESLVQSTEPQLAQVLARLTGIVADQIRSSNTIYDLGFDSISVISLARELQAASYPGATPSTILQNPHLGTLIKHLRTQSSVTTTPVVTSQVVRVKQAIAACNHKNFGAVMDMLDVAGDDIEYIAPCTPLQEGMLSRSSGSGGAYYNSFQFAIDGQQTSIPRLKGAWESVVADHAILRTCFLQTPTDGYSYVQIAIHKDASPLRWTEIQSTKDESREQGWVDRIQENRLQQWISTNNKSNEATGVRYPLEVDCIIQDNAACTIVVRIFHGVYDARSFDLILEHVQAAYHNATETTAVAAQGPSFIDVLPHGPLCDYSDTRSFWQGIFQDSFDFQAFPCLVREDSKEPEHENDDATQSRCLDIGGLEKRRLELGVTHQTIVQAAWLYVLKQQYSYSHHRWPTVGVVLSGRSLMLEGIENTIGPLFNTLPFRVQTNSVSDWPSLVRETHLFNTSVLPFVHTPLRQVQKWCAKGQPLFDTLFTFDREDAAHVEASQETRLWTQMDSSTKADYPLAFEAIATADQKLKITIVAQGHVADGAALGKLLDQFEEAVGSLSSNDQFPSSSSIPGKIRDIIVDDDERRDSSSASPQVASANKKPTEFIWTDDACALRDEIAALANLPPEEISEDANLLQLGLDSIDAIKLVSRLRKRVGLSLTTNELMRQASLRDIIERHRSSTATNSTTEKPTSDSTLPPHQVALSAHISQLQAYLTEHQLLDSAVADYIESVLPTTPLQDAMVAEMIASDFHRYFNHDVLELLPGTDMPALESALRLIVSQSPILRTSFVEITDSGIPTAYCQVVAKQLDPFFTSVTLETEEEFPTIFEMARSRATQAKGRSGLLQLTPGIVSSSGRQFVILSVAHALYDGASLDMFHQDVQAVYHSSDNHGQRPPYQPVLGDILNSTTREARNFWTGFLHDANSTIVPEKKTTSSADEEPPTVHRTEALSKIETTKLKSFCRHHRITVQTLGQACWAVVLSTLAQSLDVTFGVVMSGRDTADAQELMFPTMNTVPVRAVLHGTVAEYLQYVWENLSGIHQFQHFPLRSAQKLVGKGTLFNTLFTMQQNRPTARTSNDDDDEKQAIWKSIHSASEVEYPICIELELTDSGLMWRTACSTDHVPSPEDGEQLLRQLDEVLAYFVDTNNLDKDVVMTDPITHQISVCGMPPFQIPVEEGYDKTTIPQHSSSSNGPTGDVLEAQETLIQVLAEASGLEPSTIRPEHSIYHLGLDSISLIKVSSVLRKRGMRGANARDLLKMTSVAEMAAKIAAAGANQTDHQTTNERKASSLTSTTTTGQDKVLDGINVDAAMALAGLDKEDVETVLPAIPVQVHFLSQWHNTDGGLFFWSFKMRLPIIPISNKNIQKAWAQLVKELPILRTHFAATESSEIPFLQFVTRPTTSPSTVEEETAATPSKWSVTYRSSPFALLSVTQRGDTGLELTLRLHHALYDGISLPLIMHRLKSLCVDGAGSIAQEINTNSWGEFVKSNYVDSVRAERKAFWSEYLKGVVGAARPHRSSSTNTNGTALASLPTTRTSVFRPAALAETQKLKKAASRDGVSPQALLLAAYATVLAEPAAAQPEATKSETAENDNNDTVHDVVFGVYLANRASFSNDLEAAPFPTLSIVPLRVSFASGEKTTAIATRIQADLAEISRFENASVGLWEIEQWTQGGLRLDSFVNFLSLPKDDDDDDYKKAHEGTADGGNVEEEKEEEDATSTPPTRRTEEEGLARPSDLYLAKNAVRQTYLDAIDVEAAINAESLDIGVFASPERMSEPEAGGLIDRLVAVLRSV